MHLWQSMMRIRKVQPAIFFSFVVMFVVVRVVYYESQVFKRRQDTMISTVRASLAIDNKAIASNNMNELKSVVKQVFQDELAAIRQANLGDIDEKIESLGKSVKSMGQRQAKVLYSAIRNFNSTTINEKIGNLEKRVKIEQQQMRMLFHTMNNANLQLNLTIFSEKLENLGKKIIEIDKHQKQLLSQMKTPAVASHDLAKRSKKMQEERENMVAIHNRVYNKFTKQQIYDFYERERISQRVYGEKKLDLNKDRKILMKLFPNPGERYDRVTDQLRAKFDTVKEKLILLHSGTNVVNPYQLKIDKCNIPSCRLTRSLQDLNKADAIYTNSPFTRRSNKHQVLVNFQLESARNAQFAFRFNELNWTASYRRDSVLNAPYERFTPFLNITTLPTKPKRNFAKGKTKKIAWFVSNCGGTNLRMSYAKELQKYIQVDIYGNCGNLRCRRGDNRCFEKLSQDYKFYLAFENTNCKDYITEKLFWNGLQNDILPIVMGAHPDDYKEIAPPNSYIHIDEFESPQHLAKYLNFLDQNDHLYNQYFLWRGTGSFINTKFMCRLCTMVHLAPLFPMWYKDSNRWWYNKETCVEPTLQNRVRYSTWRGKKQPKDSTNTINYGYDRNV